MAEEPPPGPPGTQIVNDGRYTTVRFGDTDVVRIAYLDIRLDSGGVRDTTTQYRLNQVSRLFDLDYRVSARGRGWVVQTPHGTYRFENGMHLLRSIGGDHEYIQYET
jgi:hypothetical protein